MQPETVIHTKKKAQLDSVTINRPENKHTQSQDWKSKKLRMAHIETVLFNTKLLCQSYEYFFVQEDFYKLYLENSNILISLDR